MRRIIYLKLQSDIRWRISFICCEGNKNDFFFQNGDLPGYAFAVMAEGRYYITPNLALGAQYDYLEQRILPDKMHVHYIGPCNLTYSVGQRKQKCVFCIRYRIHGLSRTSIPKVTWITAFISKELLWNIIRFGL